MATITTIYDPLGIKERSDEQYTGTLHDYLCEYWPHGFPVQAQLVLNGQPLDLAALDSEITLSDDCVMVVGLFPAIAEAIAIISIALSVVSFVLAKTPKIEEPRNGNQSPNNDATPQGNLIRLGQRIPDIYGRNRVTPDLLAAGYHYVNNQREVIEMFSIGEGSYELEDWRDHETPISDDSDYILQQFSPNEIVPNVTRYLEAELSGDTELFPVNGIVTNGFNDREIQAEFNSADSTGTLKIVSGSKSWSDILPAGTDIATLSGFLFYATYKGTPPPTSVSVGGTPIADLSGQYKIKSISDTELVLYDCVKTQSLSFIVYYSTDSVSQTFTDNAWNFAAGNNLHKGRNTPSVAAGAVGGLSKLRTMPDKQTHIWINCLSGASGFKGSVSIKVGFGDSRVAPQYFTFAAQSDIVQKRTFEVVCPSYAQWDIKITREDTVPDSDRPYRQIHVESIYAVTKYRASDNDGDIAVPVLNNFGGTSVIKIITKGGGSGVTSRPDKNVIATRILRGYDLATKEFTPQMPTQRFADAMLQKLTSFYGGAKLPSEIDIDGLYEIDAQLPLTGRFCYTFSDPDSPVASEIRSIQAAVRVNTLRTGNYIHFTRDEVKGFRRMVLNRSIKARNYDEQRNIKMWVRGEFDGVRVIWNDTEENKESIIEIPEDGSGNINYKEIDAVGVKNAEQAEDLAQYEYNRMIKQTEKVTARITKHGLIAKIGDRVGNVDSNDLGHVGGEALEKDGLTVILSETFNEPQYGVIYFTLSDGAVSEEVRCSIVNDKCTLASEVSGMYFDGDIDVFTNTPFSVGSLYGFTPDGVAHKKRDYTITDIKRVDDQWLEIDMVNYEPTIFPPDR